MVFLAGGRNLGAHGKNPCPASDPMPKRKEASVVRGEPRRPTTLTTDYRGLLLGGPQGTRNPVRWGSCLLGKCFGAPISQALGGLIVCRVAMEAVLRDEAEGLPKSMIQNNSR